MKVTLMGSEPVLFTIGDVRNYGPGILPLKDLDLVQCWIFDPPYNIGYAGYDDKVDDRLAWDDYVELISQSANLMANHTSDGSLFMIHYPEATARLLPVLEAAGWEFRQWITWAYNSNIGHSKRKFTTASRTVLWMTRGEPIVNISATQQPYKNPNDKRVQALIAGGSKGVNHYDWWNINLRKNVGKGYRGWANQLPIELVERIILTASNEGGVVGDLMAGSGTLLEVSLPLNRVVYQNDISENALDIWMEMVE